MNNVVCPKCKADNCIYNEICISCDADLVGNEVRVLDKTAELWSEFLKLPIRHPDERNEFKECIHRIQDMIGCRIAEILTEGIFETFREKRGIKNGQ